MGRDDMTLFEAARQEPLAWRMRPRRLEDFVGQAHLLAPGRVLRRAIEADAFASLILYGPPGTGKTALARLIAGRTASEFISLNAVTSGLPDIRKAVATAEAASLAGRKTILFIDEIHRFNKTQQDGLLPEVEKGVVTLIGASTENPFFALVPPLASRSMIFRFRRLEVEDLVGLLERALSDRDGGLGRRRIAISPDALRRIARLSDGDARKALNALEFAVLASTEGTDGRVPVKDETVAEIFERTASGYSADDHYDLISAFIKSLRGGDADAALYWMARMLASGEDPIYLARRMVICAAEDVGNADPHALVLATAAARAAREVGMPEARIPLAQAATYIAAAPKSNAAIRAIDGAMADVKSEPRAEVPPHLRDAHYSGAARLGAGQGYRYPPSDPDGADGQVYGPAGKHYYEPSDRGFERIIRKRLTRRRHD